MIVTFFTFTIFRWIIFKGMQTELAYWINLHFKQTIGDIDLISGAVNTAIYTCALNAVVLEPRLLVFFLIYHCCPYKLAPLEWHKGRIYLENRYTLSLDRLTIHLQDYEYAARCLDRLWIQWLVLKASMWRQYSRNIGLVILQCTNTGC